MVYRHLLNFWPLSPALDLEVIAAIANSSMQDYSVLKNSNESFQSYRLKHSHLDIGTNETDGIKTDFDCLLVGSSLGCLIKTLSRVDRHRCCNLNLYVADFSPESLTRNLLFLSLLNNSSSKFSLLEKAETFLEILGNTYVRPSTATYVEDTSSEFLADIGNPERRMRTLPIVSLDLLKQCELDELVKVLTFLKDNKTLFDIGKSWENALRSYFGYRYDNRKNLYDYQFNMNLSDYSIVNLRKYLEWCETGIAFRFRKAKYNCPNKTMRVLLSDSRPNRIFTDSFVGDIATSPYLVFGVETGKTELFRKINNEFTFTSEDISKFNVIDMLEEYVAFSKSQSSKTVRVHLLFFDTLCKSRKFRKCFDVIYISCDMMHCANPLLPKFLKENGVTVFETTKNVVNSTKEQKEKHSDEIDRLAQSSGLKALKGEEAMDSGNYKIFHKLTEKEC